MRISAPLNTEFCTVVHWLTLGLFAPSPVAQLLKRFAAITSTGSWKLAVLGSQHIYLSLSVHMSLQTQSCSCDCVPQYQGVRSALQRCAAPGGVADGPQRVGDNPHYLQEWNIWGVVAVKGKHKEVAQLKIGVNHTYWTTGPSSAQEDSEAQGYWEKKSHFSQEKQLWTFSQCNNNH